MIFERALRREFVQATAGICVAMLAVLTSTQLIRLLNDAAGGKIAPEAVLALLGFSALNYMPILLILTALFDHLGRPNLVGFVFGEPLFPGEAEEPKTESPAAAT